MASDDVFPAPFTGGTVYHYTDAGGLLGMVQNHALWATEVTGMNDPGEFGFGRDRLSKHEPSEAHRETFERHQETAERLLDSDTYVVCATTLYDDVNQWARYTPWPQVGYCVGLDTSISLGVVRMKDDSREPNPWHSATSTARWADVIYGKEEASVAFEAFTPWAERFLDSAHADALQRPTDDESDAGPQGAEIDASGQLAALTSLIKAIGYAGEREVRIVASTNLDGDYVKFRSSRYGVVRYVELAAGPTSGPFVERDKKPKKPVKSDDPTVNEGAWHPLPIKSVTIGPSPFAERGVENVKRLLTANGHDLKKIRVRSSDIEMR
jgi:hypothetical protein